MKYLPCFLAYFAAMIVPLSSNLAAFAATSIEIDSQTNSFRNRKIQSGSIEVLVSFRQATLADNEAENLFYKIFYKGKLQVTAKSSLSVFGEISLADLDNDREPEVIVKTFSGGAHCCTNHLIYAWQNQNFVTTETGYLDSSGGEFVDLNGDRKLEFVTYDNAFLYAFSSYAGSYPPTLIYSFDRGKLTNVTRQYQRELRERVTKMYETVLAAKQQNYEINGILAGYVAQKILLGEYKQGWQFMLAHYDLKSENGLDIYEGDKKVGQYPNFPAALKAFLIQTGYLDKNGNPLAIVTN
jgi:hypothetical protein